MDPENYPSETSSIENESAQQPEASRRNQERSTSPSNSPVPPEKVIKIAEIQRRNIDQLNVYARNIGLRH
jgi:hypothetical protein